MALAAAGPSGRVVALDLAVKMLMRARARAKSPIGIVAGSAETLPFPDGAFSCVTAAFAVRNFAHLSRGFSEMRRVLRPGGRAVVLELALPPNGALRAAHRFYLRRLSPLVATALGSSTDAYRYLPASIDAFPDPDRVAAAMRDAGFSDVRFERLTFGVATIHVGEA
jgi:demethylmenaquinone methyltransferase / 2-methoxy-6-polyprenyl-1,4-benzoquinol methylase